MAAITLEMAKAKLTAYLNAEDAVLQGRSYEMAGPGGSRKWTLEDINKIREGIAYWESRVNALDTTSANSRCVSLIPR